MTFGDFYRGLEILRPHVDLTGHNLGAEHDEFYVRTRQNTPAMVTPAERDELARLGWTWDDDVEAWHTLV